MRRLLAIATVAVSLSAATEAQAERRMFIIPSNVDGYGVDRCLASGEKCGAAAAAAYCRSRQFAEAASYRRVDRDERLRGARQLRLELDPERGRDREAGAHRSQPALTR